MNRKTLYYLIALAVLAVGWLLLRTRPEPVEKRSLLVDFEAAQVRRMVISQGEDIVEMTRQDDSWRMIAPVQTGVNSARMQKFMRQFFTAEYYETPVAETAAKHERYGVDSQTGARLRLYDANDELMFDAWVGSRGNRYFSAFRREGDNKVYRVTEDLTTIIDANSQEWRKQQILSIDPDNLQRIDVKYSRGRYSLTLEGSDWIYRTEGGFRPGLADFTVPRDNRAFLKLANALSKTWVLKFYDDEWDKWSQMFENPVLTVDISLRDGGEHHIEMVAVDADSFVMLLDGRTDMLYAMTNDFAGRFTRAAEHFGAPTASVEE